MVNKLPKYTKNKMKGNIGEAAVQYLLSNFSLVHKIDGSNDVGNDFICELIRDQYPTNLLFYVQVKYTQAPPRVRPETHQYWKGSPIPVYLFWLKDNDRSTPRGHFDLERIVRRSKYKRCTPFLHNNKNQGTEDFKDFTKRDFLRDLLIDYSRTQYAKGFTPILKPRDFLPIEDKIDIGLPLHQLHIQDVIPEYSNQIIAGGWANMFSLAVALREKGGVENLKLAKEIIKVAQSLISAKDRRDYPALIREAEQFLDNH